MTPKEVCESAAILYYGGWRATDKAQLLAEFWMTEAEAEAICKRLAEIDKEVNQNGQSHC